MSEIKLLGARGRGLAFFRGIASAIFLVHACVHDGHIDEESKNRSQFVESGLRSERKEQEMGVAAYNRGSAAISAQIDAEKRPVEFEVMDILNSIQKYPDCGKPFGPIRFVSHHNAFWAECPVTGFGYPYPTLHEAVKRWNVTIIGYDNGVWLAEPR